VTPDYVRFARLVRAHPIFRSPDYTIWFEVLSGVSSYAHIARPAFRTQPVRIRVSELERKRRYDAVASFCGVISTRMYMLSVFYEEWVNRRS